MHMNFLTLAALSGEEIINSLLWLIGVAIIFGLLFFLVDYLKLKEPFNRVVKVALMVGAVLFLINWVLSLAGHPMIKW